MPSIAKTNLSKPAPKWFRIADGVLSDAENIVLAILLIKGYSNDIMVIYKISSEFLRNQLRRFLSNGEEYAPIGTTQTLADVTNTPIETKSEVVLPKESTLKIETDKP